MPWPWSSGTRCIEQILSAGANVSLLEPVEGLPDLVFTANAAMIFERQALLSRFRHRQRQGEEPYNRRWFAEHGFEVVDVPENFSFEGAGDALFCGDTLYAGYRMRSDAAGHQQIGRMLGVPRDSGRAGRRPLLPSRHVLLPARGRRSNLVSAGVRRVRPAGDPRARCDS